MSNIRELGLANVKEVRWGTHFCNLYFSKEDFLSVLIPYFISGLINKELCVWITSNSFNVEEAKSAMDERIPDFEQYLDKGQVEILPYDQWYVIDGIFDKQRVLNAWLKKLDYALEAGYDGIRISGSTDWIEEKNWEQWVDYEKQVDKVIKNYNMLAICNYALLGYDASKVSDAVLNHHFSIITKKGKQRIIANSNVSTVVKELEDKINDLEKEKKLFVDRELQMIELKKRIELLKKITEGKS